MLLLPSRGNAANGVVGVAPGVSVLVVRIFFSGGSFVSASDLIDAACGCKAGGANVISMSVGGAASGTTEKSACADPRAINNILIVAAAGDAGETPRSRAQARPAFHDSIASVAAVDSNKVAATFSQRNANVEIAAPGHCSFRRSNGSRFRGQSGGGAGVSGISCIGGDGGASGTLVDCGTGDCDRTATASGQICFIQ